MKEAFPLKTMIGGKDWRPIRLMYGMGGLSGLYHRAMDWCFGRDKAEWDGGFWGWVVEEIVQVQEKAEKRFKRDKSEEGLLSPLGGTEQPLGDGQNLLYRIPQMFQKSVKGNAECVSEIKLFQKDMDKMRKNMLIGDGGVNPDWDFGDKSKVFCDLSLEDVRRTGWTRAVPAFWPGGRYENMGETVADHSLKVAVLAAAMDTKDPMHLFEMGLCHDLAEIVVGDLTPSQAPDRETKHRMEREGLIELLGKMDIPERVRERIMASFMEYLECRTEASHLVHIADKLDMALQALAYERMFHVDLGEFFDSAENEIMASHFGS